MRRFAALEPRIPVPQNGLELIAQCLQLANLLIEQLQFLAGRRPNLPARRPSRAPFGEKAGDLIERETDGDRIADHAHACDR